VEVGELCYHVRGRARGGRELGSLRVRLRVVGEAGTHLDRLDLCASGARRRFAREAAPELRVQARAIESALLEVAEVLDWVAHEDERRAKEVSVDGKGRPEMTDDEKREAQELLEDPRLLDLAARALDRMGYVGEENNKRLAYLVATSRLLSKTLALVCQSESAAGKSRLMELVAELMPPEEVAIFSRITPQALYYMESGIAHKLIVVDEREGSDAADYSIRSLQSRGKLTAAVPQKDQATGKIVTRTVEIEGPVAYMESTTRTRLNIENENRCYLLHLDESAEQTARIQAAARAAATRAGVLDRDERVRLVARWRNAQRLLEPLAVEVPYAALLR
ncbi:MAG: DNA primase, partial [Myxococcota bacterium]